MMRLVSALMCAAVGGACGDQARCGDCVDQGYRIDISDFPAGVDPVPAALFSGWRNGWCQKDLICTGSRNIFLDNLDPGIRPWSCGDEELIVFSGGHAPTPSAVVREATGSSIVLADPAQVDVTVWLLSPGMRDKAEKEAQIARDTYADFGTGVQINYRITDFPSPAPTTVVRLYDRAHCDTHAPVLAASTSGFDHDRLNVYYVEEFDSREGAVSGITCSVRPDIMMVNGINSPPAVLAHEIGHALGLRRSAPLPGGGDSREGEINELNLDPYLAQNNLMKGESGDYVGQVTLGQIYRMHFDKLSWLSHVGSPRVGYPRECQNSPVESGPCPPMTLHPPRGW
jgi:hypothetical protein